jgi:HK97 family phage prohead protease
MLHKQVAVATERVTEQGTFTALAACYSVDRASEAIRPGAFAKTIRRWNDAGRPVPLHWDHGSSPEAIIGEINPATVEERRDGLYVEGRLDLEDSALAVEAWRALKRGTVALSFAYMVLDSTKRTDGVTELLELDLFEVSLTPAPANPDTRVLSWKSADRPPYSPDLWALSEILSRPREEVEAKAAERKRVKRAAPIKVRRFEA